MDLKKQLSGGGLGGEGEEEPLLQSDPGRRYVPKRYYMGTEDLNTITETEEERSSSTNASKRNSWRELPRPSFEWPQTIELSSTTVVVLTSTVAMVTLGAALVTLPMYVGTLVREGSDAYTALLLGSGWLPVMHAVLLVVGRLARPADVSLLPRAPSMYVVGVGLLEGAAMLLLAQAAPPARSHSALHPVLASCMLPAATLLARLLLHTQEGLGGWLYLSLALQLAGVLLAFFPLIFHFAREDTFVHTPWYFHLVYLIGWCAMTATLVMVTRLVTRYKDSMLTMLTWIHTFAFVGIALLFWTNLLEGLGMAGDFTSFNAHFVRGLRCFYLAWPGCGAGVALRAGVLLACVSGASACLLLLAATPRGLVHLATVLVLVTPVATVFWTLFDDWPVFQLSPKYDDKSTIFVVSGLAVTTIGLLSFVYVYLASTNPSHAELPRMRNYSTPVRIGRQQLFPALQRRRRRCTYAAGENLTSGPAVPTASRILRKVQSGSDLTLLSAASAAAAARGYACLSRVPTGPIAVPRNSPSRGLGGGLTRSRSSPSLISL